MLWVFFFFQAEDGIRDIGVTGVQTCALPIQLTKIHRGVTFEESNWMESYIMLNTKLRAQATNEFETTPILMSQANE